MPSPPGSPQQSIYPPLTSRLRRDPAVCTISSNNSSFFAVAICRTPDHAQCSSGIATARVLSLAAG